MSTAELYDKFVGFVEDMNSIGTRLKQAQSACEDAHGKLSNGRGNLVGQAQKLRQLGVKPSKFLASALVDGAYETDKLPFVVEAEAPASPPTNANGHAAGNHLKVLERKSSATKSPGRSELRPEVPCL